MLERAGDDALGRLPGPSERRLDRENRPARLHDDPDVTRDRAVRLGESGIPHQVADHLNEAAAGRDVAQRAERGPVPSRSRPA